MNILFTLGSKYSLLSGVASVLTLLAGCLTMASTGCGKDTTFDQKMQAMKAVSDFARDNDMAAVFTFHFGGRVGLYQTAEVGIETGTDFTATLLGNAADEEPGTGPDAVTMKLLEAVTATKPVATPTPARPNP